jgi:tripartite-type tricarboxylate transporter receptor subunit TctC
LADPAVRSHADAVEIFPVTSTPAEFAVFIQQEAARWPSVVKSSGMHFD